jgi:hypothetical protein
MLASPQHKGNRNSKYKPREEGRARREGKGSRKRGEVRKSI